ASFFTKITTAYLLRNFIEVLLLWMNMIILILLMHFFVVSKRVMLMSHRELEHSFSSVFHRKGLTCQIVKSSFSFVFQRVGLQAHAFVGLAVHRKGLAVVAKKDILAETLNRV
ncbi:hypothetical protein TorRG33x02_350890, partial [Trema orientale]